MTTWTQFNTDGYTDDQLETLNEAQNILMEAFPEVETQTVSDLLHNNWCEEASRDELVDIVAKRLVSLD